MPVVEVRLKPTAPFREPPRAPGLWGQMAWALRYLEGPQALEAWLERFRADPPPFRISSAYPTGFLPRPLLPLPHVENTALRKRLKNLDLLPLEVFQEVATHGMEALVAWARTEPSPAPAWTAHARTRLAIDRRSGTAKEGALYTEPAYWPAAGTLSVYLNGTEEAVQDAVRLLEWVGRLGYGGRASIGLGQFTVAEVRPYTLPEAPHPTHAVTLAPTLPPTQGAGWWRLEPYWGRLGGAYATHAKPFKRPHLRAVEGSVLPLTHTGGLLEVTPSTPPEADARIWEYLWAFPVGVEVKA
ncbi:type III-A CRISPR-associated RAMP protein Csm4 [Marinithermus hydrothermalis]|uniref:CRISPR system Cms protein Csm4 n=1 Tax=Marinithermus hydrothermalis (strain DSM 14884 / JCM 11576 / T1) TaxID=869210 RepID=F2NNA0_MARHT|nr:RAMP superfamily CRISPR-associated protein [Marinithermus hydrothermalis]AEB10941.1 CRISPR-associated RAMP protein, Csm4 family [Marinithermus hydrothermalis DSM 14884]